MLCLVILIPPFCGGRRISQINWRKEEEILRLPTKNVGILRMTLLRVLR
jgi:hypothetical protein